MVLSADYLKGLLMARKVQPCKDHARQLLDVELFAGLLFVLADQCQFLSLPLVDPKVGFTDFLKDLGFQYPENIRTYGQHLRYLAELSDRSDMAVGNEVTSEDDDGNPIPPERLYPHLTKGSCLKEFARIKGVPRTTPTIPLLNDVPTIIAERMASRNGQAH